LILPPAPGRAIGLAIFRIRGFGGLSAIAGLGEQSRRRQAVSYRRSEPLCSRVGKSGEQGSVVHLVTDRPSVFRDARHDLERGREDIVQPYAILRRSGWRSGAELEAAAARSTKVGNEQMSYVRDEGAGSVGMGCIYEATSPQAIRKHASLADLPVDDVIPIADTVVVRPDHQPAAT
jgi:hypothetical protein